MSPLLGGSGEMPAIVTALGTLTYGELDAAAQRWPHLPVHDASALPLPEALTCILAAARQGSAVTVDDPGLRPDRGEIPVGAFLLVATSGSTGRPKPLARTAASWTDSFAEFTTITGIESGDTVLITGPLHVTMHLFAALHTLWLGACVTDDPARATATHVVPAILDATIARAPQLRVAVVAGAALPERVNAPDIRLVEYYGAAELSLIAARVVDGSGAPLKLLDDVDAQVLDGMLFVRTPYAVLGVGGWFGVGDIAEVDGRSVTVRGRGSAAVNVGGTTVITEDVERTLTGLTGVRAAAAVGVAHSRLGETVAAVLELDGTAELGDIKAQARRTLSAEATPRRWAVVDALPRTAGGKIARAELRNIL